MLKFFQFSGTISGTIFFLRILFTILLSIPGIIIITFFFSSYLITEGFIDMSNPEGFDQIAFQESIEENPEEFFANMYSAVTSGWMISIVLSFIPAIWFSIASHYKRVSALFYENRKNIFAILIGFELISDATGLGILSSLSFLKTPFSIITVLIFIFLVFKNSDIDKNDHEG
jgi:uncharacterized membrane protein YhaH (DUF805 family)